MGETRISYKPSDDTVYEEYSKESLQKFIVTSIPTTDIIHNIRQPYQLTNFISITCLNPKKITSNSGFVLLTSAYETPVFWASLAFSYRSKAAFGEVRASNDKLHALFSPEGRPVYPSLYAVCGNSDGLLINERFTGNLKQYAEVEKFIDSHVTSPSICRRLKANKLDEVRQNYDRFVNYTEKQLMKLKINELKLALEVLTRSAPSMAGSNKGEAGVTEGLLEKKDFVHAILMAQKAAKANPQKKGFAKDL